MSGPTICSGSAATQRSLRMKQHVESLGCLRSRLAVSARCACAPNRVHSSRTVNWLHAAIWLYNGAPRGKTYPMPSFDEALRRDPHYQPALLAVARVHIIAAMNFIDLDPSPDLGQAERLLNEVLGKSPNSLSALYSLALLQKYRRQYQASMQSFQRCLELNPSFLPAQGQIGNI